jgi:hypothetical protein
MTDKYLREQIFIFYLERVMGFFSWLIHAEAARSSAA